MRVIDIDTHVDPKMELLYEHADPGLRDRWGELQQYVNTTKDPGNSVMSVHPYKYDRQFRSLGDASAMETHGAGGKTSLEGKLSPFGQKQPSPNVRHENVVDRLKDMDEEGVDLHVIIPGTWALSATAIDQDLAKGLYDAYHRYIAWYCDHDIERLKSLVMAPASDPQWAASQIKALADERWVSGIMINLPEGVAVDDPSLDPIWDAMCDADLPLLYHSFFYEPPYFPGYRDVWGNLAVARTAAHPWGAQRILAYLTLSGMFDKWPNFRVGFSETGAGWLPNWLSRLDFMSRYLASSVPDLKKSPIDYARDGNIFCGIQLYEGGVMARAINEMLGDGVLMYQSDYPHGECEWPESVNIVKAWEPEVGAASMEKLLAGNAERYLRLI
jgi:predicted TIM-barrel fold metal-dependent hydrolase